MVCSFNAEKNDYIHNHPPPSEWKISPAVLQDITNQCWGRYFEKVTSYILLVTFRKSNSLHITDYF